MGNFLLSKLNLQVLNKVVIIPMDGVALILEPWDTEEEWPGKCFASCERFGPVSVLSHSPSHLQGDEMWHGQE